MNRIRRNARGVAQTEYHCVSAFELLPPAVVIFESVTMLQRRTGKSIIIGSVIIGTSLIIALNFTIDWARDATKLSAREARRSVDWKKRHISAPTWGFKGLWGRADNAAADSC